MIGGTWTVKDKIEQVLRLAGRPIAPHEFAEIQIPVGERSWNDGRIYVGCTESTLARRLRELVVAGKVKSRTREGKGFKEFGLSDWEQMKEAAAA